MFGFTKPTISVVFLDAASGEQFAAAELPLAQLPDTFAVDTDLEIAGQHYVVVRAEPQTKAAFAKTKRLAVTLRKVEAIDPRKILFSMPSLCGAALPATVSGEAPPGALVLHEDDWRQCELVSTDLAADVSAELASIRRIHATAAEKVGWRELHVRERISHPLPRGTKWQALVPRLGDFAPMTGVSLGGGLVVDAVAGRFSDGVVVWGVEAAGELTVLCLENIDAASSATAAALMRIADERSFILVRWCRCQAYAPGGASIANAVGQPFAPGRL